MLVYMGLDEWKAKAVDGKSPSDVILSKYFTDTKLKLEGDESSRRVRITISTKAVDRDNDTIDPAGWDIQNYRRNPVVLWAHQANQLPIARAVDIIQNDDRLVVVDEFVPRDLYPLGDTVFQFVKGGWLRSSSVGFKPKKSAFVEERRGFDFLEQELLEHSIVPVPSNPEAVVEARSVLGAEILEPLRLWCEEALDCWHGEKGLWLPKSKVEQVFDTLNTTTHFDMAPKSEVAEEAPPVDTTEKALEILTSIEEKLTALLGQKQTDEPGAVEPEIVEEEENDLNDVFASLTQGMNNNALLAEIDETQLRGAMRQALGELIPDLVKTQYTSITGRLVD